MRPRLAWISSMLIGAIVLAPTSAFADPSTPPTPAAASSTVTPSADPSATPSAAPTNTPPTSGSYIGVTLVDSSSDPAEPVPGVTIEAMSDGKPVGDGVTDEAGRVFIPIPGRGQYTVTLDKDSLPKGIEISGTASKTITALLDGGNFVQFPIGVTEVESTPFAERLAQASVQGLKLGLIIALASLGLSMIFGTTGLTNFAHGEIMTFGAFATLLLNVNLGFPIIVAGLAALLAGALFGWLNDRVLWRPLRRRGVGLIAMMIVSIGLSMFLRSVFQLFFGSRYQRYDVASQRQHDFGPFSLAPRDIWVMSICLLAIAIVCVALMTTRIGKATRAVADNPALAASSGLRVDGVISVVWTVGAALTALAGALTGLLYDVNFTLGFNLLLLLFASVTLGGLGTIWGALLGSLVIGIVDNVGPVFGVPESIKHVGPLAVLILVLLLRPQGILGRRERIG